MWTPHHQQMIRWEQTHHRWVGECVAKPPPTRDRTHHLQRIKWESFVASPEIGTPSCSFPFAASLPLALAGGFQGTRKGAPTNHELSNQNFADKHQLFYWDVDLKGTFLYPWIFWMFINVETLFLTYGYLKCLKCKNMPLIPCLPIYIWLNLWSYIILGWVKLWLGNILSKC